jgi:hypothetical protein
MNWPRLLSVVPIGAFRVRLRFADGVEGEVDLSSIVFADGVFSRLRDEKEFARVRVDPNFGSLAWAPELDLAPEPLYDEIVGRRP